MDLPDRPNSKSDQQPLLLKAWFFDLIPCEIRNGIHVPKPGSLLVPGRRQFHILKVQFLETCGGLVVIFHIQVLIQSMKFLPGYRQYGHQQNKPVDNEK